MKINNWRHRQAVKMRCTKKGMIKALHHHFRWLTLLGQYVEHFDFHGESQELVGNK